MSPDHDDIADGDGPVSMEEVDCPGCDAAPARLPKTIIDVDGEYWHIICLLEKHPQIKQREQKRCPDCGTRSKYRPLTRSPEARACPRCGDVFPEDAPKRDDVTVETPPFQ